ncbi:MAG: sigma-70 family RNA polymerase sigma factor [Candidatus Eisenbacteria bacterium]|nr:sigma-70 family RNA polymerase sigma factor [Candidatus Eisenbacteria bacterium]
MVGLPCRGRRGPSGASHPAAEASGAPTGRGNPPGPLPSRRRPYARGWGVIRRSTPGRVSVSEHTDKRRNKASTGRDPELVARLKAGDEKAFEELVTTYQERVYRVAWRMVRDDDVAEDVAQEAFIKVFRHIDRFQERSSIYTWIYRITVNIALNKLKRDRFRKMVPLGDFGRPDRSANADPARRALSNELAERVDEAVKELPEKQRLVFTLKFYEEMSHREIAEVVGCSEGTSKANYFHAIRKLRKALADLR